MFSRPFPTVLKVAATGFLAALLYAGVISPFRLLNNPILKTQDFLFSMRYLLPYHPPILEDIFLIAVDDESIHEIKEKWPFHRRIYADLLQKLTSAGARLVALDFVFAGKSEPLDDFLLAEAVQKAGHVVLAAFVDAQGNYVLSLKEIREGAVGSGVVNKLLDDDLYVRRVRLVYKDNDGEIAAWPWEIEILKELQGLKLDKLHISPEGLHYESDSEDAGRFFIPFRDHKNTAINFKLKLKDIQQVPLWKVMQEEDLGETMKGKIVLSGSTSRGLHDYYHTPLGVMPGVVVNLNWLVNMATRDFLRNIPFVLNLLFVTFFAMSGSFLGLRFDVMKGTAGLFCVSVAGGAMSFGLFCLNYTGDFFTPFLALWLTFLSVTLYRYFYTLVENVRLRGEVVTDPLTGLYNRRFLESRIDAEFARLVVERRSRKMDAYHELSVLMMDIDNFKHVNDTYGHQFGDDVIKNVSFCIRESVRKDDIAARYGGEEFCVVLIHTRKEEAVQIAEKIRKSVESKKFNYVNQITHFTISAGVASARIDNLLSSRAIIKAADEALYEAKRTGKNRVCQFVNKTP